MATPPPNPTSEPLQITEPPARRGRNDLRRNLVGLARDELKGVLAEAGLEPFRAQQIWHWIYWHGVTDFERMTNVAKKTRERLAELFVIERPQIVTEQRSVDGTRKWLLRFPDGNEAETVNHSRGGSRLGLRLQPGRLHAHLQLLPHRHPAAGAQPHARRDRGPVHGGPGQLRRMADADPGDAHAQQHRHDGHGRAAVQFRQCRERAQDRHGRPGHRLVAPAHHAVDFGRRADDPEDRRGARRQSCGVVACRERRRSRYPGADQQEMADRGIAEGVRRLSRARATAGASPSSTPC